MACKLRCPNCGTMCKEFGDEAKRANGTYVVVSAWSENILKCSKCNTEKAVSLWGKNDNT